MSFFNRLTAILLAVMLAAPLTPIQAKTTRKGDKYLAEGRSHENKREWDAALEAYEKALAENPEEMTYQMAVDKARFQAAQEHVSRGVKIRAKGQLGEALLEFQRAYAINPGSAVAVQEIGRTQEMILRERKRVEETGREAAPEQRGMTPAEDAKKQTQDKINRILPVPELKPLSQEHIPNLKINSQPVKVLFDTLGKVADINVLWDPEYQKPSRDSFTVDFQDATIEQALDYAAVLTKSYWKPLAPN